MTMFDAGISGLLSDLDVDAVADAPLGPLTWYGIGGRADLLVRPRNTESLATLIKRCRRSGTPLRILGSGANLLVSDDGVDGVVVRLDAPAFREIRFNPLGPLHRLKAMAGAGMARTLMDATRRGLSGLTQMAGIPASIGGAIVMNAGGTFGAISDRIESVTCLTRDGDLVTYPASEIEFGYRQSNIPDPIIIDATFDLEPSDPIALRQKVKEIFAYKKSTQPLADHSAGCIFRNPYDPVDEQRVPAGRLIEQAGLKGTTIGSATVSPHHANFIVTRPGATASDVLQLLDLIRSRVFETAGLELQEELVIWRREDPEQP